MTSKKFRYTKEKMMGSFFLYSGGTDCVVIDDGEKSYEYSYPEVFKVESKLIGEILFEKIVRV